MSPTGSGEKKFFAKTKIKMALAAMVAMAMITFAKSIASANGLEVGADTWTWLYGAVLGLVGMLMGTHTATDIIMTKKKADLAIVSAQAPSVDQLVEVAKRVGSKKK